MNTSNECPATSPQPDAPLKPQSSTNIHKEKTARILLRRVDVALKEEGVEAAIKELMQVRLVIPLSSIIRAWLRDYRDMLDAWHNEMMPEIVDEFHEYGFRRARNLVCKAMGLVKDERKITYYVSCERVLSEMAKRSRLAISDVEECTPAPKPKVMPLNEVPAAQLARGTKF